MLWVHPMKHSIATLAAILAFWFSLPAADAPPLEPASSVDRVGFPTNYPSAYQVLRTTIRKKEQKVVTVYGNSQAASVTNLTQLPYPHDAVLVMETCEALKGSDGQPVLDSKGELQRGKVAGLHVMRHGKDFGAAYGKNRSGDWEYVEYRADGSYITPPAGSASCSACHIKAGTSRDFVYHGRFADSP